MTDKDNAQGFEEWWGKVYPLADGIRSEAVHAWENRTAHYEALLAEIEKTASKLQDDHYELVIANKEYRKILKTRIAELEAQIQEVKE